MCRRFRLKSVRPIHCCAILCVAFIAALPALAGSDRQSKPETPAANDRVQRYSPMIGNGIGAAPYAIRLRITGFLARQHAREGDTHRALLEFFSMLNVDDPAWSENPEADSLRIARDLDVARMMSDSGFYEHAIRVLQTTLILARANGDPQAVAAERQLLAAAESAKHKNVAVPSQVVSANEIAIEDDLPIALEPTQVAPARSEEAVRPASPASDAVIVDANDEDSSVAAWPVSEVDVPSSQHTELHEATSAESNANKRSQLSRLLPKRRFQGQSTTAKVTAPSVTLAAPQPLTTQYVARTDCTVCATAPQPDPQPQTRAASHARPILDRIVSRLRPRRAMDSSSHKIPSHNSESPEATTTPRIDSELELATQLDDVANPQPALEDRLEQEMTGDEPEKLAADASTEADSNAAVAASAAKPVRQVAVIGNVRQPGIFAFEGNGTTLAALLRRTSRESNESDKRTRILRADQLHRLADAGPPAKRLHSQRDDASQPTSKDLETPILGQELVLVDGPGDKPIYLAVMPYFVLQIPPRTNYPVTAEQIVDQLGIYWPNIRQQELGVIWYEEWSGAVNTACVQDANTAMEHVLHGGDVLYVDGLNLDRSQALSAAQAISQLAGAKIRCDEPSVQQTSGSSK